MNNRYSSVDRAKENIYKRPKNTLYSGANLVLGSNDINIDKILNQINTPSIKSTNSHPKKLPSLYKKISNQKIFDIYSKYSDFSTTANQAFTYKKGNNEKNNNINIKTESNTSQLKNYYNIIIHSNFSDRTSINNTQSSLITDYIKPILITENTSRPTINNFPNSRLYPIKYQSNKDNYSNSLKKVIKNIKNKEKINYDQNYFKKIPIMQTKIAFNTKYQNEVFDANKVINNYRFKENELKVPDNDKNDFITKNKNITISNILIDLMNNESKKLKEFNEKRAINLHKSIENIDKDEKKFEEITNKQRELYYKISDQKYKLQDKYADLINLLNNYKIKAKTMEDEIFKKIEQIESLRKYARFVHKVLGGDEKLFEEDLIPNYENDNRPDINILIKIIYNKYGYLLNRHRFSIKSSYSEGKDKKEKIKKKELLKLSDSENDDDNNDLLDDPDLMIRKYKELEDKILRVVERTKLYNKTEIEEVDNNKQLLREMRNRVKDLEKEYDFNKKALKDYIKNEFGKNSEISEEDFCNMAFDLCQIISQCFNNNKKEEKKKEMDILELNDEITKCMNIMIKKEGEVNNYLQIIENMEKNEKKLFELIMNQRKIDVKRANHKKIKDNLKADQYNKMMKVQERMNKIMIKIKKYEPPIHYHKKEDKPKDDINEIIRKENEEMLQYK